MAGAHEKVVRTAGYGYRVSWIFFISHGTEMEYWKQVSEDILVSGLLANVYAQNTFMT